MEETEEPTHSLSVFCQNVNQSCPRSPMRQRETGSRRVFSLHGRQTDIIHRRAVENPLHLTIGGQEALPDSALCYAQGPPLEEMLSLQCQPASFTCPVHAVRAECAAPARVEHATSSELLCLISGFHEPFGSHSQHAAFHTAVASTQSSTPQLPTPSLPHRSCEHPAFHTTVASKRTRDQHGNGDNVLPE